MRSVRFAVGYSVVGGCSAMKPELRRQGGGTALVFGDPITDSGQDFIAYQSIGAGDVFVIADTDTTDNINSTATNKRF